MRIGFWGSSLVSAYWNGAATYYRGILRALAGLGADIIFYEPDAYNRQKHRDIADPDWARIVVYDPEDPAVVRRHLSEAAATCDVVVKASGVGVLDEYLEAQIAALPRAICKVFWDVDAPATLERLAASIADPFHSALPHFDAVLTYGGGTRVTNGYRALGARDCTAIYNGFDPDVHYPVDPETQFACDVSFLGNRLPDRENRVNEFFIKAACLAPEQRFLLGGSGWGDKPLPPNIHYIGHVYTGQHNAFNCSARLVLNIARDSMARYGFSPATRVFEAAGAGACLVTDAWDGIDSFLKPDEEILIAESGGDVARFAREITPEKAREIGNAARERVLRDHTYSQRGALVYALLEQKLKELQRQTVEVPA